jgi:hypothetical protein
VVPDLVASGGRLVSVNPLRETLEDFFVKQIAAADRERPGVRREAEGERP